MLLLIILPTLPTLDPDLDFTPYHDSLRSGNKIFHPGIFIEIQSERLLSRDEFLSHSTVNPLSLLFDNLLSFLFENEDKVFNPGFPDFEDSRAYSIHKSYTSSSSFWESQYPNLID
ncbi:hypothetical protein Tco_1467732 [Tanacetum coccineum]